MSDFLRALRRHWMLLAIPAGVFIVMLALAIYLLSRPVLGTVIYQP